jgi:hypothetical protein
MEVQYDVLIFRDDSAWWEESRVPSPPYRLWLDRFVYCDTGVQLGLCRLNQHKPFTFEMRF